MLNHGKCKNVRVAITIEVCEEMRQREARVCIGCPGPLSSAGDSAKSITVDLADHPRKFLVSPPNPRPQRLITPEDVRAFAGQVDIALCSILPEEFVVKKPGFFVDFTGHEELLQQFSDALREKGLEPSESALDLIYLFAEGLLSIRK